jgi:hypothetical protein
MTLTLRRTVFLDGENRLDTVTKSATAARRIGRICRMAPAASCGSG